MTTLGCVDAPPTVATSATSPVPRPRKERNLVGAAAFTASPKPTPARDLVGGHRNLLSRGTRAIGVGQQRRSWSGSLWERRRADRGRDWRLAPRHRAAPLALGGAGVAGTRAGTGRAAPPASATRNGAQPALPLGFLLAARHYFPQLATGADTPLRSRLPGAP